MNTFFADIRYAVRMIVKRPGFTLVAILSLALGIGGNAVVFSLVNTVLLRGLPVQDPGRVFSVCDTSPSSSGITTFSYPDYVDLRDQNQALSGLAAYRFAPMSLSHQGQNERIWGYVVSGNYFDVLGVKPVVGRAFLPEEDRVPDAFPVAVLAYRAWQGRFSGDLGIVGSAVTLNGHTFTIVGVAPKEFNGTEIAFAPEIYVPAMMARQAEPGSDWLENRGNGVLFLVGRLKAGESRSAAEATLTTTAAQVFGENQKKKGPVRLSLYPPGLFGPAMREPVLGFSALLMVAVGLVLLIACSNLASLLLARATERRKEIATRLALGASRLRLIRQLLTESILFSLLGGGAGALLAWWAVGLVSKFKPPTDFALTFDLALDYRVLTFTLLLSVATGVVFGLAPALRSTRQDLAATFKDESAIGHWRRSRLRDSLVVAQVALSLILLIAAGLIVRGLGRAEAIQPGFNPASSIQASFDLALQGYDDDRGLEFEKRVIDRVSSLPGIESATLARLVPLSLDRSDSILYVEGEPLAPGGNFDDALKNEVWPGYFHTMQIQLISGREFTERDKRGAQQVVVVNEEFGRRFIAGKDPVGRRIGFSGPNGPFNYLIVGVAKDGKYVSLGESPKPMFYQSLLQAYRSTVTLVARTNGAQTSMASIRGTLNELDSNLPLYDVKSLSEQLDMPLLPARVGAGMLGGFGLMALLLAAIGIYGVVSYAARQRTREIGIRMALGASRADVVRLIVRQGMTVVLVGLAIGLVGSLAISRFLSGFLYGISPRDAITYGAISLVLGSIAFVACYLPARRSADSDPMVALRYE